jgi:hypothetical protein
MPEPHSIERADEYFGRNELNVRIRHLFGTARQAGLLCNAQETNVKGLH